jgi:hypothetical protein
MVNHFMQHWARRHRVQQKNDADQQTSEGRPAEAK